jgi:hypothetical protein
LGVAVALRRVDVDGEIGKAFGYPFDVAVGWESGEEEGQHLEFGGNSIEVFGFVFIDLG